MMVIAKIISISISGIEERHTLECDGQRSLTVECVA